jgi:hypothetical protein
MAWILPARREIFPIQLVLYFFPLLSHASMEFMFAWRISRLSRCPVRLAGVQAVYSYRAGMLELASGTCDDEFSDSRTKKQARSRNVGLVHIWSMRMPSRWSTEPLAQFKGMSSDP